MDFISYLRVSTQRQGQSGLGIEAQRSAVSNYLRQVQGNLLEEYVEVESGTQKNRPVLVQSIAQCRACKATLLIAKLDRLGRNVAFVSSLMEGGVEFVAADAPYANRLMIHILAAFAEHERTLISERTKAALAAAKARGVALGTHGSKLAALRKAEALRFSEVLRPDVSTLVKPGATLEKVAFGLNRMGHRTPSGAAWSIGTTHRLLQRLAIKTDRMRMPSSPAIVGPSS